MQSSDKIAAKRDYNMQSNFAEIVDLITTVEQVAVNERIEAGTLRQINSEDVRFWNLKEDDFNIYCDKTGNKINDISSDAIIQMLSTHSDTRVNELITNAKRNCVDPNWLFTDSKSLESLSETDPIGYFVFAASAVLRCYQPYWQGKETTDPVANDKWREDKASLNNALHYLDIYPSSDIVEINELMRRYLTITQTLSAINRVKFTLTSLPTLHSHLAQFKQELIASIEAIIEYEYREAKIKTHLSYADIVSLNLRYKGYANFRGQKSLKGMSEMDQILAVIEQHTPQMNSIQQLVAVSKVEIELEVQQQATKSIKHEGGPISFNIPTTKAPTIKLSVAQMLQQKVK